jgi:hypothetical protein
LTNIADIAAIGGFNPNKYLSGPPPPQPVFQFTAPQQVFEKAKGTEADADATEDNQVEEAEVKEPVTETEPEVVAVAVEAAN